MQDEGDGNMRYRTKRQCKQWIMGLRSAQSVITNDYERTLIGIAADYISIMLVYNNVSRIVRLCREFADKNRMDGKPPSSYVSYDNFILYATGVTKE